MITFEQFLQFRGKPVDQIASLFDSPVNVVKEMSDFANQVDEKFRTKAMVPTREDYIREWAIRTVTIFGSRPAEVGTRPAGTVPEDELVAKIVAGVVAAMKGN